MAWRMARSLTGIRSENRFEGAQLQLRRHKARENPGFSP